MKLHRSACVALGFFAWTTSTVVAAGPTTSPSDAGQLWRDADAVVVRTRESVLTEMRQTPEYQATLKAVQTTFTAYNDRRPVALAATGGRLAEYRNLVADADARINAARSNPATTPEQFDDLYRDRARCVQNLQGFEDDTTRHGSEDQFKAWVEASRKLIVVQDKQVADVEQDARVRAALAARDQLKPAGDQTGEEYLHRYPKGDVGLTEMFSK